MTKTVLPSKSDIVEDISRAVDSELYEDDLRSSPLYHGQGATSLLFYLDGGGRNHPLKAYRKGLVVGANLRVVDDLLDGDGCEQVQDRERFLDNYIETVETGVIPEYVEVAEERAAYRAGKLLREAVLDREERLLEPDWEIVKDESGAMIATEHIKQDGLSNVLATLKDMRDMVITEDKSSEEGYLDYVAAAGGNSGSLISIVLDTLPDYTADTRNTELCYDIGVAGQIADDKFDADTGVDPETLDDIHMEALERLESHDSRLGNALVKLEGYYPYFARSVKFIGQKTI